MVRTDNKRNVIKYLLALCLFFYPLRHAFTGIDLMDAGYALGNYRFFAVLNPMWKLATYLANVVGLALSKLPFGDCWIGMNLYCGLPVGAVAAAAFLYVCRLFGKRLRGGVYLFFIAELTALSLCWAPNVILYHYLGYLLMTIASMVLYRAIVKDSKTGFVTAGVILGLCVAVRMPNVTYMAFILPLWYFCFIKREKFGKLVNKSLYCMGGYAAGVLVTIGTICIRYGVSAYPEMIASLFGVTETATDYKPTSMLAAMFGDYAAYSVWLGVFVVYGVIGAIALKISNIIFAPKANKNKIAIVIKTLYLSGMAVLIRLCYGRGMFDFYYTAFFSMYKWVTVYLLVVIIVCVWALVSAKICDEAKLWAVFLLVTIFITPLGSNNGLYPIINNLFLVAPVSIVLLAELLRTLKGDRRFITVSICVLILVCTAVQSNVFGICFLFHDVKTPGEKRETVELQCSSVLSGLKTTAEKKQALEGLDDFLYDNALNKERVILYGDIPAIAYIFDMEPAVFTTWADLDSNSIELLERDLTALYRNGEAPVVIVGKRAVAVREQLGKADKKYETLNQFMEASGYQKVYENSLFEVFST